jgi:hypothetical protein
MRKDIYDRNIAASRASHKRGRNGMKTENRSAALPTVVMPTQVGMAGTTDFNACCTL